jgi:hypothetical protein
MLDLALALVMVLDTIPAVGIAVPGDVAILTAMGVSSPWAEICGTGPGTPVTLRDPERPFQ